MIASFLSSIRKCRVSSRHSWSLVRARVGQSVNLLSQNIAVISGEDFGPVLGTAAPHKSCSAPQTEHALMPRSVQVSNTLVVFKNCFVHEVVVMTTIICYYWNIPRKTKQNRMKYEKLLTKKVLKNKNQFSVLENQLLQK